jgi:predicted phage terminase large subunit-like protein
MDTETLPTCEAIDAEFARRRLRDYLEWIWPIVEPSTPFIPGWHLDAICDHLEAVTRGAIRHLLITVPPRHTKSLICSVAWPTWTWATDPALRFLFASYAADLSTEHAVLSRRVIESARYQGAFGHRVILTTDQNIKTFYENTARGYRMSTSVGGSATGRGADWTVIDDPHNLKEIHSEAMRSEVVRWHDQVWSTRLNDPEHGGRVVIMQRGHEQDLGAHLLARGGYVHLNLPSEYEPTTWVSPTGWKDPRKNAGELLCPARVGPGAIAEAKRDLGSYGFGAQHQQRPSPAEGGLVKRHWWRFYTVLPPHFDEVIQSWDMAFKGLADSDYVVGQPWGRVGADCYLLDQTRDRMTFTQTKKAVTSLSEKWPQAWAKYVEDTANGPAVIDALSREIPGLIAVKPEGSKIARVHAVSPIIESGNVWLPDPSFAPWVQEFIEEWAAFPNGANDDQVDAGSQALRRLSASTGLGITLGATQPKEADERLPHLPEFHNGAPIPEHAAAGCLRCQSRLAEVR